MKLLDEVRNVARLRRLALETERCYARWIEQYIRFHKTADGFRHPNAMGADEVESVPRGRKAVGSSTPTVFDDNLNGGLWQGKRIMNPRGF